MRDGSLTDPEMQAGEALDRALRPQSFDDYVGQDELKANLRVYVDAARRRGGRRQRSARNAGRAAAETTANRVQSEVESAWNGGVLPAGFTSRNSAKGLSQQARQAGNAAEVSGGMQAATDESTTPDGWRIVALVRTSMMDGDVCAHWRSEDGATFIENEEGVLVKADSIGATPEGTPWANYPPLPDSGRCFGRPACRCRWLPVYGR